MKRSLFLVSILVAACGDNGVKPDAFVPPDHDADLGDGSNSHPTVSTATVVAGDFTVADPGVISTVDDKTFGAHTNVIAGVVGDDPITRLIGDELFIVNRADGNNVTILDANNFHLKEQLSTGDGSNPQDVAPVGNKLYVPVFGGTGVAVLTRGSATITTIDLSADDAVDHNPDCNSAFAVGTKVFVTCELLIGNGATGTRGPGKVHVIDTADDSVEATFDMMTKNPLGVLEQLPDGNLAIGSIDFATGNGCVEKITTTGTPASGGCIVQNTDLGNVASRISVDAAGNTLWMSVAAADFSSASIVSYDLGTDTLGTPISIASTFLGDVAVCPDGNLAVSDGTFGAGGLRFFAQDGTQKTTDAIAVGLTPSSGHGLSCK